ncbi:MAG: DUF3800 domain-containing protein [Terracidiphilus sp.]
MPNAREKLYCYVDETGQDATARFFVVVAVVSLEEQDSLRRRLEAIEREAGTGHRKWHKSRSELRLRYLALILGERLPPGHIFFGTYRKPIPYFFPFVETVEGAIKATAVGPYAARVYIDGIDRQKAAELTNALRDRGVVLQMVKGRRDESEPIIRLADMWAGCIRAAQLGGAPEKAMLERALATGRLVNLRPSK